MQSSEARFSTSQRPCSMSMTMVSSSFFTNSALPCADGSRVSPSAVTDSGWSPAAVVDSAPSCCSGAVLSEGTAGVLNFWRRVACCESSRSMVAVSSSASKGLVR